MTGDITYYGLALDGKLNTPVVPVMNTDDCFRHFLLDTTNQTQLSAYMSQTADHILQPFPVGLSSDVGLFVANPAYSGNKDFAGTFSRTAYHGTVVWSWQLAMMGAGLARQLSRCSSNDVPGMPKATSTDIYIMLIRHTRFLQRQDSPQQSPLSLQQALGNH